MTQPDVASDVNDAEIIGDLRDYLAREFPKHAPAIARLTLDTPLAELRVLDSLGLVSLITFVEAKWGVKVPAKTYKASFQSLGHAKAAIEQLRNRK